MYSWPLGTLECSEQPPGLPEEGEKGRRQGGHEEGKVRLRVHVRESFCSGNLHRLTCAEN